MINWKKIGGRKFTAAFLTFITVIVNSFAGNAMNIEQLALAVLGFITFIIVEGIIDFRGVNKHNNGESGESKITLSGELKKRLRNMETLMEMQLNLPPDKTPKFDEPEPKRQVESGGATLPET